MSVAADLIQEEAHENAEVIWGCVIDDSLADNLRITVIATDFDSNDNTIASNVYKLQQSEKRVDFSEDDFEIPEFIRRQLD